MANQPKLIKVMTREQPLHEPYTVTVQTREPEPAFITVRVAMSNWTHPICQRCWAKEHPGATPVKVKEWHWERCCYCGKNTRGGIFVRQDPADTPMCTGHGE